MIRFGYTFFNVLRYGITASVNCGKNIRDHIRNSSIHQTYQYVHTYFISLDKMNTKFLSLLLLNGTGIVIKSSNSKILVE